MPAQAPENGMLEIIQVSVGADLSTSSNQQLELILLLVSLLIGVISVFVAYLIAVRLSHTSGNHRFD